jgi:hypothetical protein
MIAPSLGLAVGALIYGRAFDERSLARYGYRFLTRSNFLMLGLAAGCFYFGGYMVREAATLGITPWHGLGPFALGALLVALTAREGYVRTSWQTALVGTSLQLVLLPLVLALGAGLAFLILAIWAALIFLQSAPRRYGH